MVISRLIRIVMKPKTILMRQKGSFKACEKEEGDKAYARTMRPVRVLMVGSVFRLSIILLRLSNEDMGKVQDQCRYTCLETVREQGAHCRGGDQRWIL